MIEPNPPYCLMAAETYQNVVRSMSRETYRRFLLERDLLLYGKATFREPIDASEVRMVPAPKADAIS